MLCPAERMQSAQTGTTYRCLKHIIQAPVNEITLSSDWFIFSKIFTRNSFTKVLIVSVLFVTLFYFTFFVFTHECRVCITSRKLHATWNMETNRRVVNITFTAIVYNKSDVYNPFGSLHAVETYLY